MDRSSQMAVGVMAFVLVVCTGVLATMLTTTNKRLAEVAVSIASVAGDTEELASATRVHYEPQTFVVDMTTRSKIYEEGHGIPACRQQVMRYVNGDTIGLYDLFLEGWYVLSVSTHEVTGNQNNQATGRLKPESETGYKTCDTQGLLYILRKDLGTGRTAEVAQ